MERIRMDNGRKTNWVHSPALFEARLRRGHVLTNHPRRELHKSHLVQIRERNEPIHTNTTRHPPTLAPKTNPHPPPPGRKAIPNPTHSPHRNSPRKNNLAPGKKRDSARTQNPYRPTKLHPRIKRNPKAPHTGKNRNYHSPPPHPAPTTPASPGR